MDEATVEILVLLAFVYLGILTKMFRDKKQLFSEEIEEIYSVLDSSKNAIESAFENIQESMQNLPGGNLMDMIQVQRAQIVTNLLEFGAQKLAQKFGGIEVGIHQIEGPDNVEEIVHE